MRTNLKLSQKAFILIAVPLFFQVLLLSTLAWLLSQAEDQAHREQRSRQVMSCCDELARFSQDAGVALYMFKHFQSDSVFQKFEKSIATMRVKAAELHELTKNDVEEDYLAAKVTRVIDNATALGGELNQSIKRGDDLDHGETLKSWRTNIFGFIRTLLRSIHELAELEQMRNQRLAASEEQGRQMISYLLIAGVGFNFGLAIFLARYFNAGTSKRLDLLMDNSLRLASGKTLNRRLGGNDEIGRLDLIFHEMAKALQEAARKERAIIENALDVICSVSQDLSFVALSHAAKEILGLDPEELVGKRIETVVLASEAEKLGKLFELVKAEQTGSVFDTLVVRPDGTNRDVRWSAHWSPEESSFFCVIHDITAQRQVERLKQEFVSMIGHDLRTPLMSVQASLCLLSEGVSGTLPPAATKNVHDAERNVNYIIGLINSLLDVERIATNKLEVNRSAQDLADIVESSVQAVLAIADRRKLKIAREGVELEVYADSGRIVQVLINLLSNALKFSHDGTTIKISARKVPGAVEVQVADRGRGIPASHLQSIFGRFEQVEATDSTEKGGSGLGLAICKAIIDAHDGQIGVDSELGAGSRFWFRLPDEVIAAPEPKLVQADRL